MARPETDAMSQACLADADLDLVGTAILSALICTDLTSLPRIAQGGRRHRRRGKLMRLPSLSVSRDRGWDIREDRCPVPPASGLPRNTREICAFITGRNPDVQYAPTLDPDGSFHSVPDLSGSLPHRRRWRLDESMQ